MQSRKSYSGDNNKKPFYFEEIGIATVEWNKIETKTTE